MMDRCAQAKMKRPYGAIWHVLAVLLMVGVLSVAEAQEQFFTQSGGRGLQNAKTNARLTKAETDIGSLQAEVARVKPHAFAELGACGDTAEKLRWDGNNWICEKETDPTVQSFAKKALPSCGNGTILSAQGGDFACVPASFVSDEVDPTVQNWAKSALPACGSGEILSVSGGNFACVADKQGLPNESDPYVHDFAKKGVATVPNCSLDDKLIMVAGRLICSNDKGLVTEVDPAVQDFARNDISGSSVLAACAAGEVLKAVTENGKVRLACSNGAGALTETLGLNDLNDVTTAGQTSGTFLGYNGSEWRPLTPIDPTVQAWARTGLSACPTNQVLSYNGSSLVCVADAGAGVTPTLAGLSDVNIGGVSDGQFLRYDNGTTKWVPATVQAFALATLPTCGAGQVLSGNGISLSCVSDSGATGSALNVASISVTTNAQVDGALTAATAGFGSVAMSGNLTGAVLISTSQGGVVSASRVHAGVVSATSFVGDGSGLTGVTAGSADWYGVTNIPAQVQAVSNSGAIDLSTLTANVVSGTYVHGRYASFTDVYAGGGRFTGTLRVDGDLQVSGSQTIDGVIFANGGIQMSGAVESGAVSVTDLSATVADIRTLRVTNNQTVGGTSEFTGQMTAGNVSATRLDLTDNLKVSGTSYVQDMVVRGNLQVSGSQTIDGVIFANGGIQMSGAVTSGAVSVTDLSATVADIRTLRVTNNQTVGGTSEFTGLMTAGNVSVTGNQTLAGSLSAGSIGTGPLAATNVSATRLDLTDNLKVSGTSYVQDMVVRGNLQVSGSQTIDGVIFANGGIQMSGAVESGTVSATYVYGRYASFTDLVAGPSTLGSIGTGAIAMSGNLTGSPLISTSQGGVVSGSYVYGNAASFTTLTAGPSTLGSIGTGAIAMSGNLTGSPLISTSQGGVVSATQVFANVVSATSFVGDGSGLTGVVASTADRIVSGTTSMLAVSSTGYVSLTQAGVNTGWFDPARGLVTLGVSATGGISGTTGYYSGNVGIGGVPGSVSLQVSGSAPTIRFIRNSNNAMDLSHNGTAMAVTNYTNNAPMNFSTSGASSRFTFSVNSVEIARITAGGVSTTRLVVDDVSVSANVSVTGNVSANRFIGDGSGLTGVVASSADWYGLTNIPAQVQAVSNSGAITLSTLTANVVSGTYVHGRYASFTDLVAGPSTLGSIGTGAIAMSGNLTGAPLISTSLGGVVSATQVFANTVSAATFTGGAFTGTTLALTGNLTGVPLVSTSQGGVVSATYVNARYISGTTITGTFSGDGSGLTGVVAGSSDRIVSGTTSMLAVSSTGYVSLTQAGVNTGWFDPARGLVTLGVSATGGISGTTGYFAGNVGIGTTAPSVPLHISTTTSIPLRLTRSDTSVGSYNFAITHGYGGGLGTLALYPSVATGDFNIVDNTLTNSRFFVDTSSGNVGVGTTVPSGTLHVSGTVMAGGTGSETCSGASEGLMRLNPVTKRMEICLQ